MGLSRKLGGVSAQKGNVTPGQTALAYQWSTQSYTIQEIFKKFKLPCVVQCVTDSCTVVWSDFQFDLRQPLLLYSRRTARKVHARSLKMGVALEEFGPPLAIPEDYDGWFGASAKGISKLKRHLRIEGVANSSTRHFLVTTKCHAYTTASVATQGGGFTYVDRDVMPGEVLTRVCVMDGDHSDPDTPGVVKRHGPCLECLDEKGEDVIIPLANAALVYEVTDSYPDSVERVFPIQAVVKAGNSSLPRILRVIHGDPPLLAFTFTGMLRCYSIFTEETILAATMDDTASICLELATDSCARFNLGLNQAAIKKTLDYNNALQMCEAFGAKFLSGIKVSFALKPEMSGLDDIDLSFYENASVSDTQEVDANSEFEIAWGSGGKVKQRQKEVVTKGGRGGGDTTSSADDDVSSVTSGAKRRERQDGGLNETNSHSSIPQHRDFTERDIKELMVRKGLLQNAMTSEILGHPAEGFDGLEERQVTDNPLYYFFQRNPDQDPRNKETKEETPDDAELFYDEAEIELAETEFRAVPCTPAREYVPEDKDDNSDSSEESDTAPSEDVSLPAAQDCENCELVGSIERGPLTETIGISPNLGIQSAYNNGADVKTVALCKTSATKNAETTSSFKGIAASPAVIVDQSNNSIPEICAPLAVSNEFLENDSELRRDKVQPSTTPEQDINRESRLFGDFGKSEVVADQNGSLGSWQKQDKPTKTDDSTRKHNNGVGLDKPREHGEYGDSAISREENLSAGINEANGFYPGLSYSKKAKSDDRPQGGASSSGRKAVFINWQGGGIVSGGLQKTPEDRETSREKMSHSVDSRLHKYTSENNLSSLFPRLKEGDSRFESPKVTHHPHTHPHNSGEYFPQKTTGKDAPARWQDLNSNLRPGKNISSLSGKVLSSIQNFEQLTSSAGSNSSNDSNKRGRVACRNGDTMSSENTKDAALKNSMADRNDDKNDLNDSKTVTRRGEAEERRGERGNSSEDVSRFMEMDVCGEGCKDGSGSDANSEEETVIIEEYFNVTNNGDSEPVHRRITLTRSGCGDEEENFV